MLYTLKERYGLSFRNKVIKHYDGEKINNKIMDTVSETLNMFFLRNWTDIDEVETLLLRDIDLALISAGTVVELHFDFVDCYMRNIQTKFFE